MTQVLIFVLVVCLALVSFAWAGDAWSAYNHNMYLVEAERTNQVQIHEHGLTQREVLITNVLRESMPEAPVVVVPVPTATLIPPGMVVIYVSSATATAMATSN